MRAGMMAMMFIDSFSLEKMAMLCTRLQTPQQIFQFFPRRAFGGQPLPQGVQGLFTFADGIKEPRKR